MRTATTAPGSTLLTPTDHTLMLIDHQAQMAFATRSIDVATLRNHVEIVVKAAVGFGVDLLLTTVAEKSFSGPMYPEIAAALPKATAIDRTTMNAWEDHNVIDAINRNGKERVVLAGLWTSVCIVGPALSALEQGFEVYVIADACGDVSVEAHERAMQRVTQAGARPLTSLQYLLELQRDWARTRTYGMVTAIARQHGGGYGLGIDYAKSMFGASEATR